MSNQLTLAHEDFFKRLCVFKDASEFLWSEAVTLVPVADLSLPLADQRHKPLAFLSGHFRSAVLRWLTSEKEAYAITASIKRTHWLLATDHGFDLYTDHNNLIFLFNPCSVFADLSQITMRKVLRGAVRLSAYHYMCISSPRDRNYLGVHHQSME